MGVAVGVRGRLHGGAENARIPRRMATTKIRNLVVFLFGRI
jgi:hypothetical protein